MKTTILQNFLQAQERTTERISLEFNQHRYVEFWHFTDFNKDTKAFCITSEDISLEEFYKQMVEYLNKL